MQLYGFTGVGLFAIVCWITSTYIASLAEQIETTVDLYYSHVSKNEGTRYPNCAVKDLKCLLNKWARLHLILIDAITQIQNCFGTFLFIFVVYIFVNVVVNSFYLVDGISRHGFVLNDLWGSICLLVRCFTNLFVLSILPITLQNQVYLDFIYWILLSIWSVFIQTQFQRIVDALRRLYFKESPHLQQV